MYSIDATTNRSVRNRGETIQSKLQDKSLFLVYIASVKILQSSIKCVLKQSDDVVEYPVAWC